MSMIRQKYSRFSVLEPKSELELESSLYEGTCCGVLLRRRDLFTSCTSAEEEVEGLDLLLEVTSTDDDP